jgi:hypothetical protein
MITRRTLLLSAPLLMLAPRAWAKDILVTLYRDPGCGCCENYVAYLRRHGFAVTVKSAAPDELAAIGHKAGIPPDLQGCHTTFIAGYAVDGLVPIAAVQKLLKDRPPLKGITLPGMPPGAPGMTGTKKGKLTVFAISKEGSPSVFMTF